MPIYTQSATIGVATSASNFAITAGPAGTTTEVSAASRVTLTYTAAAVGNLVVFYLAGADTSTTVTSTRASGWTQIVSYQPTGSAFAFGAVAIWTAVVTSTGSDTITVSNGNGSGFNDKWFLGQQQFVSAGGTGTTWTAGAAVGNSAATNVTTLAWPVPASLPQSGASAGFLYAGLCFGGATASCSPGAGYATLVVNDTTDKSGWVVVSNPSITTAAVPVAPSWTGANTAEAVGVYIGAYPSSTSSSGNGTFNMTPVPMGKSWVVSQIGFEVVPTSTVSTSNVTTQFNGRLLFGNTNANGGFIQGPPYVTISAGDTLTFVITGLPAGVSSTINLFYNEYIAGQVPNASNTV